MTYSVAVTSSNGSDWLSIPLPDECTALYQIPLISGDSDTLFVECRISPLWHLLRIATATGATDELDSFHSSAWPIAAIGDSEVLVVGEESYTDPDTGEPMTRYSIARYDKEKKQSVIFSRVTNWSAAGLKNMFLADGGISYFTFNHDVYESTDKGRSWNLAFRLPIWLYGPLRMISGTTAAFISGNEGIVLTTDSGHTLCDVGPFSTDSCRHAMD